MGWVLQGGELMRLDVVERVLEARCGGEPAAVISDDGMTKKLIWLVMWRLIRAAAAVGRWLDGAIEWWRR